MAKGKKPAPKKPTIRIPARPLVVPPTGIDESADESLEFTDHPAPHSKAEWSAENLDKEDDEPEVDELNDGPDEEPTYGSDHSVEIPDVDDIRSGKLNSAFCWFDC